MTYSLTNGKGLLDALALVPVVGIGRLNSSTFSLVRVEPVDTAKLLSSLTNHYLEVAK